MISVNLWLPADPAVAVVLAFLGAWVLMRIVLNLLNPFN